MKRLVFGTKGYDWFELLMVAALTLMVALSVVNLCAATQDIGVDGLAVDLLDERLETAKNLGAAYTVNPREEDPVARIQELGGADAVIATAVSPIRKTCSRL